MASAAPDPASSPKPAPSFWREHLPLWLVLSAALVTFLPSLGFGFVTWDDPAHLTRNPLVVAPEQVPWLDQLLTPALGYPTPITVLSYRVEHALFGLESAAPYHATNVALHLIAVALVYLVGRRMALPPLAAALAAALFGLHPVVAEPVSWVTGRKDLLAAVFVLAAAWESLERPFSPREPRSWLAMGLFALAVLSKPVTLFLVPVVFAWRMLLREDRPAQAALAALPLAIVAALDFPLALLGQRANDSIRVDQGLLDLLREAWYALGYHLGLVSLVQPPCVKHLPTSWPPDFTPTIDLLPLIWIAAVAALLWRVRGEHRRLAAAALIWSVCAYLPSSNLIPLSRFVADVYVYLPLAGVGWLLGAWLDASRLAEEERGGRVAAAVVAAVTVALMAMALPSSARWRNSATLWADGFEQNPHDYRMCRNLGNAYNELGERERALALYQRCAATFGAGPFEKNIAVTLTRLGRTEEARAIFERLARERPGDPVVRRYLKQLGGP